MSTSVMQVRVDDDLRAKVPLSTMNSASTFLPLSECF